MKILSFSDTHEFHNKLIIPKDIDVVICCGDFTNSAGKNNKYETENFLSWFNKLENKYKILIAGNHEAFFEYKFQKSLNNEETIKDYLKKNYPNIIYLQDESIIIEKIKFYGTPWCPLFYSYSFMKEDKNLKDIFSKIDNDTNVLITHTPAYGVLDYTNGCLAGSFSLFEKIKTLKDLKYHFFGHIHENSGQTESIGTKDKTDYIAVNCAFVNYLGFNQPKTFEI